jgi:tRNA(fMet)-specific endonuclease VapC
MSLKYLLDTNICIYIAKQQPDSVYQKFASLSIGEVGMSTITYGELYVGIQKSPAAKQSLKVLQELMSFIPAIPLSTEVGKQYGIIRSHLEHQGKTIGNNDLWIAAHALDLNLTLVTNNHKEFTRIPMLRIENWVG